MMNITDIESILYSRKQGVLIERQDNLTNQLKDLADVASILGMIDAAEYLRRVINEPEMDWGWPEMDWGWPELDWGWSGDADENRCDCQNPEPVSGVALVSNECPIHNLFPKEPPKCDDL